LTQSTKYGSRLCEKLAHLSTPNEKKAQSHAAVLPPRDYRVHRSVTAGISFIFFRSAIAGNRNMHLTHDKLEPPAQGQRSMTYWNNLGPWATVGTQRSERPDLLAGLPLQICTCTSGSGIIGDALFADSDFFSRPNSDMHRLPPVVHMRVSGSMG